MNSWIDKWNKVLVDSIGQVDKWIVDEWVNGWMDKRLQCDYIFTQYYKSVKVRQSGQDIYCKITVLTNWFIDVTLFFYMYCESIHDLWCLHHKAANTFKKNTSYLVFSSILFISIIYFYFRNTFSLFTIYYCSILRKYLFSLNINVALWFCKSFSLMSHCVFDYHDLCVSRLIHYI